MGITNRSHANPPHTNINTHTNGVLQGTSGAIGEVLWCLICALDEQLQIKHGASPQVLLDSLGARQLWGTSSAQSWGGAAGHVWCALWHILTRPRTPTAAAVGASRANGG